HADPRATRGLPARHRSGGELSVVAKLPVGDEDAVAAGRLQWVRALWRGQRAGQLRERVEEGLRRLPRLPHRLRDGFPALDAPEVPAQDRRPALAVEEVLVPDGVDDKPPELGEVVAMVVHPDEPASRTEDTRDLRESGVEIGEVVQHPVARDEVEFGVAEREPLDVRHLGVKTAVARLRDGRLRLVDAHDHGCGDQRREIAVAAAGVEHTLWVNLRDCLERQTPRLVLAVQPGRSVEPPRREPLGGRVLPADERGIADPAHPAKTLLPTQLSVKDPASSRAAAATNAAAAFGSTESRPTRASKAASIVVASPAPSSRRRRPAAR